MRRAVLVRKTLRDVRGATLAISAALFLIALFVVLVYPGYKEQLESYEMPSYFEGFMGEAGSIASIEGFLTVEFFSWVPILLITLAIIGGTGTLAGEEGAGTLDLLLAQPVSRRRLLLEKAAGLALAIGIAALVSFAGFLLGTAFVEIEVSLGRVWWAVVGMVPISLLFLAFSLWAAATLPGRGMAAALVTGIVVVSYFLYTVGTAVDALETPRKFSPFYWSDAAHILLHGFDWARAGGLLAVAALFLALALWRFEQRDIGIGAREWRFHPRAVLARLLRRPLAAVRAGKQAPTSSRVPGQ